MNSEKKAEENYWTQRYDDNSTGWDIGYISAPLKAYFDQLTNKNQRILIPGAGNSYEAEYLHHQGFTNVFVLDISATPLKTFAERTSTFPKAHLLHGDFFEHKETYDLIIEQTFFCSFEPTEENRRKYSEKMAQLLLPQGKLVGLWFKHPLTADSKRPFGGTKEEYISYLSPYFNTITFEDCYNSITSRKEQELFGIFKKS